LGRAEWRAAGVDTGAARSSNRVSAADGVAGAHEEGKQMRYMLLIYDDENLLASMSPEERDRLFQSYGAYHAEVSQAGVFLSGDALQPTGSATTVRVRDEQTLTTDGPYAETKEQLGGFYMLECENLDEAIRWAAKIPSAALGSIEVRPVMEMSPPE
jgi:hypothetical protein